MVKNKPKQKANFRYLYVSIAITLDFSLLSKQGGTNGWTAAIKSYDHVGCFSWPYDSLRHESDGFWKTYISSAIVLACWVVSIFYFWYTVLHYN